MSLFSDERVDSIAERIYSELQKRGLINNLSKIQIKSEIKKAYIKFYRLNEEIDIIVRKKIKSMSKAPQEGTRDYKVLYEKYFQEEWKKH